MNAKKRGKGRSSAIWVVSAVAVIVVAGLIGASVWSARGGGQGTAGGATLSDAELGAVRNAIGPADAPVTVIEYMDYACPACATAHSVVVPELAEMAAAGDVRFEVHFLPIFDVTGPAIFAVECAGEQGFWWAMHSLILENQTNGIRAQKTFEDLGALLTGYAADLGLDMDAFRQCLASEDKLQGYIDRVNEQIAASEALGIRGTPTFVVNGEPLALDSWNDLLKAVREELNRE